MKPIIGITQGDSNGIGPEIILKSLHNDDTEDAVPLLIGSRSVFGYYNTTLNLNLNLKTVQSPGEAAARNDAVCVIEPENTAAGSGEDPEPGKLDAAAGKAAMLAVEKAAALCLAGEIQGMVTAPISKEAVNLAGWHIPGHTEFLTKKTGADADSVIMILISGNLKVALATVHIPVAQVASSITKEVITKHLTALHNSLTNDFGIPAPDIAVLGLNPHAGDGGVLGTEEQEIINPAIQIARNNMIAASGPFPADGFFGQKMFQKFDAVLAMYHDQGLAPFKALSFGSGVNFTAGLPIIRTSPDHGTAFSIAGQGVASFSSMQAACKLAAELAHKKTAKL